MPLSKEVLSKYKKDCEIFIETGTLHGDAIDKAIELNFKQIYSCELSERLYLECLKKYQNKKGIYLYNWNSNEFLEYILKAVNEKSLFWLDAHYSGGITSKLPNKKCPVVDELNQIKKHSIKEHTILIDDVRLFGTDAHDNIKISELTDLIHSINSKYKFTFENDILVAEIV